MAKYGKTLAQVIVEINGKQQVQQVLKAMEESAARLRTQVNAAKADLEELAKGGSSPEYDAKKKELSGLQKELNQLTRAMRETKKLNEDVGTILDNMANYTVNSLNKAKRSLTALMSGITPNTKKAQQQIEQIRKAIQLVSDEIDRRKGKVVEFSDIMGKLGKATPQQLDMVEKRLESLLGSVTKNSNAWKKYSKELRLVQEEKGSRKKSEMEAQMENVSRLSVNARNELKKYWQAVNDDSRKGTKAFRESLKYLQQIEEAEKKLATDKAAKVMAKPQNYSVDELNEAIKITEQLQAETKSKKLWAEYAEQIARAKEERDKFADTARMKAMAEQFKLLDNLSVNALAEQKKYWEGIRDSMTQSDKEYKTAIRNLEKINALEKQRMKDSATSTLTTGLQTSGTADIKQSVDWLTKYQATLEPLGDEWRTINDLIEAGNNRLKEISDTTRYEAMVSQFGQLDQLSANALSEQKKYWESMRDSGQYFDEAIDKLKQIKDLENSRMKDSATSTLTTGLQTSGTADIKQSVDWLTKYQATLEPLGGEWRTINDLIEAGNNRLKEISDTTRYEAMVSQFGQLDQLSANALSEQKKYWESMRDSGQYFDEAIDKLKQIKDLETLRVSTEAKSSISEALSGGFDKTNEETREAIRLIEEYKKHLETGNVDAIKEADKAITELNRKLDQAKLSSARDVVGNLGNFSSEQIKGAVDWLAKYRSTLATTHPEWQKLGDEIRIASEYLEKMKGADTMRLMTQQMQSLGTMSTAALAEQKKYWQDVVANTDRSNTSLSVYEDNLRKVIEEEKSRKAVFAESVMNDLPNSSVEQIREAIKATEELRESVKRSSPDWEQYNSQVENAKNYLESFETSAKKAAALDVASNLNIASTGEMKKAVEFLTKYRETLSTVDPEYQSITKAIDDTSAALKKFQSEAKMDAMNQQMQNLGNLSKTALAEQKKYWQEVMDSALNTSKAYQEAERNLLRIQLLEEGRTSSEAGKQITDALSGNWDKSIKETEEAVKLIQEYKNQLRTKTDAAAIKEANEAIEILNRSLGKAKEALMDVNQAKQVAQQVTEGLFDGTSVEIEKARKALEEYRKTLKLKGNASEIEEMEKALNNLARSAELGGKNLKDLDAVLGDLKSASVEELQTAAKQLQQELQGATRGVEEYARTADQLRRVNRELERAKKEWEGQESLFVRMTRRLAVYMAAYGSLSAVTSYVKDLGKANLQLSDSIADVAKTTGLEADELAQLGKEIRAIDTRTAQEQLYELAAAAGQLGVKSETEIAGFVRAANMITVSLNELGTEATTQLMKIATLTGEAQKGTETALLSIGSAINELTASSAAAAGPIVDLMNRMGGIAAQSGITSAQMAAIGATADALGQSVEITGTSMNKFLATLMSNSDQIAYALNMDAKALRSFINEGRTIDAVVAVFERMNDMGGLGKLAPVMGELGSEGARMTQVLAAMAEKVEFLKGQLDISTRAYEEAVSIQNEYNVKNENAIAILQRMGNAVKEFFVNNVVVDAITSLLRSVYRFFSLLSEGTVLAKSMASALIALTVALISTRIQWVRTINEMNRADIFRAVLLWVRNLTTGTISLTAAWNRLGKVLKANWFSILIGAVAGLATWIYKTATYVSDAAKATAKYNRELQEEKDKVDQLFRSLNRLSSKESERAGVINQINQQYGQYLGFMLDEKDSAEKLAAAHQLINAELRKRMALNLQNTLTGKATNEYAEKLEKTIAGISTKVENLKVGVTKADGSLESRELYTTDVMHTISEMINDRVYNAVKVTQEEVNGQIIYRQQFEGVDLDALKVDIKNALKEQFAEVKMLDDEGGALEGRNVGQAVYTRVLPYIENLLNERVEYQKKIITAEQQANIELRSAAKSVLNQRNEMNDELVSEIDKAKKGAEKLEKDLNAADKALKEAKAAARKYGRDDDSEEAQAARTSVKTAEGNYAQAEKALKEHYTKMVDNANDYVANQQQILKEHYAQVDSMEDGEKKKQLQKEKARINAQIDTYTKLSKEVSRKVPGIDPWGKGRDVKDWKEFKEIVENIDTSSATALAAAYKKIKEDTANIPYDVEEFYNMFDTAIDKDLNLQDPDAVAKQVHNWAEQIRNKLRTKYGRNTSLGFIFDEEGGGGKKRDEIEAALASLEAYYNERQTIIRKNALLEEATQEELDKRLQSLEQEHLSARVELRKFMAGKENEFFTDIFEGPRKSEYMINIDYSKVLAQVEKGGKATRQKLEKDLTADMVAIQKLVWEYQEEISRILLENDPVKKVALEYQNSFEKIDMFWSDDELRTKDAAREKMATLLEFSTRRSELSDKDMRKQLEESKHFGNIVKTMTAEEYKAFLILLEQYAEAATNANRRATQQAIRSLEFNFDNSFDGKQIAGQLQHIEEFEKQVGELNSSGLTMEATSLDKQKELVEQRIALELYKWNAMIVAEQNGMNRQEVIQELMLERDKATYQARLDVMKLIMDMDKNMFAESSGRIDQMQGWGAISETDATERQRALVNAELELQKWRIDEMIRLEEEGQNRREVIDNLKQAKQNALMKSERKLTELTMKEYQQRAQIANEWGTAIGNGLGEMIAGTEDAGKTLVKNLATMAVQSIGQMAQMYVAKQLLLSQQNAAEATAAMATATTAAAEATAVGAAKTAEATAIAMATPDSVMTFGAAGAARAAVISGLIAAAVAASIAIINSLFPGSGKNASASNRKLSTGMLTYAEGNYPVLGNDGKVYDAKYEGAGMKTGIYGGGAHFGIFSEKQPEMIVDGKTTQKLILNYPYIYDAITTIAKNGRLVNAMPTFASGDYPAGMQRIAQVEAVDMSGGVNEQMDRMTAALEQSQEVNRQLLSILAGGKIVAHLDGMENHKQQKKNERFLKRRRID